jgi:HEAT repeat protein
MAGILEKIQGGDRRSIGRSEEVAADVLANPALFETLFRGMLHANPLVRMRAADAVEKITLAHPEYLQPFKEALLQEVAKINQQEVRWHVAQMLPRLTLSVEERQAALMILTSYLTDKSKIVHTFSLQAMADLAEEDQTLVQPVLKILTDASQSGSPAVKSRVKKLQAQMNKLHQSAGKV